MSLSPISEADEHVLLEATRQQATLQQLTRETERLLRESRQVVAAYRAASEKMNDAIHEARVRLAHARSGGPATDLPPRPAPPMGHARHEGGDGPSVHRREAQALQGSHSRGRREAPVAGHASGRRRG